MFGPLDSSAEEAGSDAQALLRDGLFGDARQALSRIDALVSGLHESAGTPLLLALAARARLLDAVGAPTAERVAACDALERAAQDRRTPTWTATAHALRAVAQVDAGDIGAVATGLARAELEVAGADAADPVVHGVLDALATAYARLRLHGRHEETRQRLEAADVTDPLLLAAHWSHWAVELAVRALEPVAAAGERPDGAALQRCVEVASRLQELPVGAVPRRLARSADGARALAATYRERPAEALRLLGQDAFGEPRDLPPVPTQLLTLAALRAHALVGAVATARSRDEAATSPPPATTSLVLQICRARERLWLETHAGGDVVPILHRIADLLARLAWHGMSLASDTASQALEHHSLRTESRTDALTGVGNRRALDEEMRRLLRFTPLPLSLVIIDIDRFKEVNDRFTHLVGDEVLRRVAVDLAGQLRTGDRLVRYGGDEFVVLLPGTGDREAHRVAARMSAEIERRAWAELADDLAVTVSTGCAALWSLTGRRPDSDAERLFRRADEALLEAKRRRVSPDLADASGPLPPLPAPAPQPAPTLPPPAPTTPDRGPWGPAVADSGPRDAARPPAHRRSRARIIDLTHAPDHVAAHRNGGPGAAI